jgi:peptidoglycan-N-acetylglucosamine deacetylase
MLINFRRCFAFLAIMAVFLLATSAFAQKHIALSFDDVPRQAGAFLTADERSGRLLKALQENGVKQAAFFVTVGNLEKPEMPNGAAHINAYVAAGHVIANHSWSHGHLSNMSAEDYLSDIDKAGVWLKGRRGYRPWFRYPYLGEGGWDKEKRDAVRAGLAARGLSNGYVTADGSDWHLEQLTIDAVKAGKSIDMNQLRRLYVASQMSGIAYHDELARRTLGRSPAHVMLLHETDLAALFLGDLIKELKQHGWTIIAADKAFRDPIAGITPDVPFTSGTNIGMIAWQRDIKPPMWPIWMSTEMITVQFNARVIKKAEAK